MPARVVLLSPEMAAGLALGAFGRGLLVGCGSPVSAMGISILPADHPQALAWLELWRYHQPVCRSASFPQRKDSLRPVDSFPATICFFNDYAFNGLPAVAFQCP